MANDFMGTDGYVWWMGIVENRIDPLKVGRCQVRIFAWNTSNKSLLPTEQLAWAIPVMPLGTTTITPPPEGTMVQGYFMDGVQAQHPMITGWIPGIPDQTSDPSHGFSDPRTNDELKNAPRPPQNITYDTSGSGVKIQEASNANRFPGVLNEPTTSRLARNENIQDTIVQQKINSTVSNIPVATGGMEVPGIDVEAFLSAQINLPTLNIPPFAIGLNKSIGFEICGIGIGLTLSAGFNFSGLTLGIPTITIEGDILIGGIPIDLILSGLAAIGDAVALIVDLAGCLLAGTKIGNQIMIDGGILLPLLQPGRIINFGLINQRGTISGGVSLGTIGGIPASTPPMWNEPITPYNASYPYNRVTPSESGHVIEIDDTPGSERIHTYHRSGTFQEMHPDGSMVTKTTNHNYKIAMADDNTNVMGSQHTTVNTDQSNMVQGDHTENINGKETVMINGSKTHTVLGSETRTTTKNLTQTIAQDRFIDVKGNDNILVEGKRNVTVLGDCNLIVKGSCTLAVRGTLNLGATGDTNLTVGGDYNVNIAGDYNVTIVKNSNIEVVGSENVDINGNKFENVIGNKSEVVAGARTEMAATAVYQTQEALVVSGHPLILAGG